jgi:antirestriction protein ArdC
MKIPELQKKLTEDILAQLEDGVTPWHRPWRALARDCNGISGREYNGTNILLLDFSKMIRGYTNNNWYTFKSVRDAGGDAAVRKGERGTPIIYYNRVLKDEGTPEERLVPIFRVFYVFNREQIDGEIVEKGELPQRVEPCLRPDIDEAVSCLDPRLSHAGDRAFYRPSTDEVRLPDPGFFESTDHYYSTLFHELIHWTGHPSRLNRKDLSYGAEELVAELGAAFLCREFRVNVELEDHSSYIGGWIEKMREEPSYLFNAMADGWKASEFIMSKVALDKEGAVA